jgi:hypothetical protein
MTDDGPSDTLNAKTGESAQAAPGHVGPDQAPVPPPLPTSGNDQPGRIPGSYPGSNQPSNWPKTFGIISCVLAGANILYTPLSTYQQIQGGSGAFDSVPFYASFPQWFQTFLWSMTAIGMAEALLLLLPAGILLIKRRPASVMLHRVYAVLAILTTIASSITTYTALQEMRDQMDPWAIDAFQTGLLSGTLFGLAYPAILLWWFFRPRIRKEVAQWTRATA